MEKKTSKLNRRQFINMTGLTAATLVASPRFAFSTNLNNERPSDSHRIRIGIIGGRFGAGFNFHEHPQCIVEGVSDLITERRDHLMEVYKCSKSYPSLERLILDPKIDAVFIATEAPNHHRHVKAALNAGKHVLCAVPAACTIEECHDLRDTVRKTGLTYMMAETSVYMQNTISVKKFYDDGLMGEIFSAAAEYNHPGLETLFSDENGKPTWRRGFPPLKYSTHCTSFLVSVTGERLTHVSGLGWGDESPLLKNNAYNNPFWNGTAFYKTSNGIPFRCEINWKGALINTVRAEWRGNKMSFLSGVGEGGKEHTIVRTAEKVKNDDAGFEYKANTIEKYKQPSWWEGDMLPKPLRHDSGHDGSHTFITHEFIDSLVRNRRPTVDIYEALAYTAPGIVAHQSALKGGEYLKIPDFDR